LIDKGNLDDEMTTLDSMDMMDSESKSEFSVWLGFELEWKTMKTEDQHCRIQKPLRRMALVLKLLSTSSFL